MNDGKQKVFLNGHMKNIELDPLGSIAGPLLLSNAKLFFYYTALFSVMENANSSAKYFKMI